MVRKCVALIGMVLFISCSEKRPSNEELFKSYFDENVEVCAKILLQNNKIDSLEAVEYSKCMLNKLYEIDSTFIRLPPDSMSKFVIKNVPLLRKECGPLPCDSID